MQRRRVLAGLAAAGMSLLAGCSSGGNDGDGSGGNNTTQPANNGGNGGGEGTPLEPADTATPTPTSAATTMATTAQQTATQMATTTPTVPAGVEPTPTTGPTSVPPTTGTTQPTATPIGTGTTDTSTATGLMDIDLSNLETYTTDSYSIKRPAGWQIAEKHPNSLSVVFKPPSGDTSMGIMTAEIPSSLTADKFISKFIQKYKQEMKASNESFKLVSKQSVTLSNGNSATMISFQGSTGLITIRQEMLFTVVNGTVYGVIITIPKTAYTTPVAQQIEKILLSLTIHSGSSSG